MTKEDVLGEGYVIFFKRDLSCEKRCSPELLLIGSINKSVRKSALSAVRKGQDGIIPSLPQILSVPDVQKNIVFEVEANIDLAIVYPTMRASSDRKTLYFTVPVRVSPENTYYMAAIVVLKEPFSMIKQYQRCALNQLERYFRSSLDGFFSEMKIESEKLPVIKKKTALRLVAAAAYR